MEVVKIDGTEYEVATTLGDLRLADWLALREIIGRREQKNITINKNDEPQYIDVPIEEESTEFKQTKIFDLVSYLSGIDRWYFEEYEDLFGIVSDLIDWENLFVDDSTATTLTLLGEEVSFLKPSECEFQRWADYEGLSEIHKLFPLLIYRDRKPYNRFHPDYKQELQVLERMPAKGALAILESINKEGAEIRDRYFFVYQSSGINAKHSLNIEEHSKRFKWEDVIFSIAETNLFNGATGTLNAVRNANTLEVLEYLNLKRSRDTAEYKDYQASQKQQSK